MPDPAAVIEETRVMLGMFKQLGLLRASVEDDAAARHIGLQAQIELDVALSRKCWAS